MRSNVLTKRLAEIEIRLQEVRSQRKKMITWAENRIMEIRKEYEFVGQALTKFPENVLLLRKKKAITDENARLNRLITSNQKAQK